MADAKISALTPASALAGTEVLPIVQSGSTKKVATDDLTVKNVRSNATTGLLQITGPGVGTTRTMTVPNANFSAARIDASQTFTGAQTFGSYVEIQSATVDPNWNSQLVLLGNGTYDAKMVLRANSGYRWSIRNRDVGGGNGEFTIRYEEGSLDALRIDRSGNAAFYGGNVVIGTSGKGIDFSATAHAAGMTSELFDDYETGTWTPSVTSASGVTTVVDNVGRGSYTKVGRMVHVYWSIGISTDASVGTSDLTFTGLPYTPASGVTNVAQFAASNYSAGDYGTGGAPGHLGIISSGVLFSVRTVNISSRSTFYWAFAGWYYVD